MVPSPSVIFMRGLRGVKEVRAEATRIASLVADTEPAIIVSGVQDNGKTIRRQLQRDQCKLCDQQPDSASEHPPQLLPGFHHLLA
jgi:hypothetical protein